MILHQKSRIDNTPHPVWPFLHLYEHIILPHFAPRTSPCLACLVVSINPLRPHIHHSSCSGGGRPCSDPVIDQANDHTQPGKSDHPSGYDSRKRSGRARWLEYYVSLLDQGAIMAAESVRGILPLFQFASRNLYPPGICRPSRWPLENFCSRIHDAA